MLFIIHVCIDDEICSHAESRREVQDSMLPQLKEARWLESNLHWILFVVSSFLIHRFSLLHVISIFIDKQILWIYLDPVYV